jgi:hypothetical protein
MTQEELIKNIKSCENSIWHANSWLHIYLDCRVQAFKIEEIYNYIFKNGINEYSLKFAGLIANEVVRRKLTEKYRQNLSKVSHL